MHEQQMHAENNTAYLQLKVKNAATKLKMERIHSARQLQPWSLLIVYRLQLK